MVEESIDGLFTSSQAFIERGIDQETSNGRAEQIKMTPLMTRHGLVAQERHSGGFRFKQIALLGHRIKILPESDMDTITSGIQQLQPRTNGIKSSYWNALGHANGLGPSSPNGNSVSTPPENRNTGQVDPIYINTETPWSAFLCGSQGSGKSHTLSCMLENCVHEDRSIGRLPRPLAGIVFHYDNQTQGQPCEAAHLASLGIPVRVLVSASNSRPMTAAYKAIPSPGNKLEVEELYLRPEDLNTARMMQLMGVDEKDAMPPLYIARLVQILRDQATKYKDGGMLSQERYRLFKDEVARLELTPAQIVPLKQRTDLLESYMKPEQKKKLFEIKPGILTIVDLSTGLISPSTVCALFNICLELFLEQNNGIGKVIALDEAHKYMNDSENATAFTETLLTAIRLQRHAGARLIISTQEPTVSPKLLDLCSMTIVHRFTSPAWYNTLRGHIGALAKNETSKSKKDIFADIMNLKVGESFLFAPTAVFDTDSHGEAESLGMNFVKMKTRMRLSADGGRSRLAAGETETDALAERDAIAENGGSNGWSFH